jgi:hypothetical protein
VSSLLKVLGILLLIPAGLMVVLIPFAAFDEANVIPGLLIFVVMFGGPGGLLLHLGRKRAADTHLQHQMVGFVRSHDAFAIAELAAHIGKTPAETQTLLTADIARYRLPLIMHRASGRYLRTDRLTSAAQIADRCQSCGGTIDAQIVFAGEQVRCPYCSSVVQPHAPYPTSSAPGWGGYGAVHGPW